jgi:hypothetical protein
VLSFVGDTGYTDDGVEPELGTTSMTYIFKARYNDFGDDSPKQGYPKLHVYDSGIEITSSPFTMVALSSTGFVAGVTYYHELINPVPSMNYSYWFETYDVYDSSSGTQARQGPVVSGNCPLLSWAGSTGYITDGVEPDIGFRGTMFVFKIMYTDKDNDPPAAGYPKLKVFKGTETVIDVSMSYDTGSYVTGAVYITTELLSACSYYTYKYYAVDKWGFVSTGTPVVQYGPNVQSTLAGYVRLPDNSPMQPAKVNVFGYETKTVNTDFYGTYVVYVTAGQSYNLSVSSELYHTFVPGSRNVYSDNDFLNLDFVRSSGTPSVVLPEVNQSSGTSYVYRIKYVDNENDPPGAGYPQLVIYCDSTQVQGSPFLMSKESGPDYRTGMMYSCTVQLSVASQDYSYYIIACDKWNSSCTSQVMQGPVVNTAPVISWTGDTGYETGGVSPGTGDADTSFRFKIRYIDTDGHVPDIGYPKLYLTKNGLPVNGSPFVLDYLSGTYSTCSVYGIIISSLVPGPDYSYSVSARDVFMSSSNVLSGTGPDVKIRLSGHIYDPAGVGMNDVRIFLSGAETMFCQTNQFGYYEFLNLTSGVDYLVSISTDKYEFYPSSRSYHVLNMTMSNQDFNRVLGLPVLSYIIEPGYNTSAVYPSIGTSTTTFSFKIMYIDKENDLPKQGYPRLHVSESGVELVNSPFVMVTLDICAYSLGRTYQYSINNLYVSDKYACYFECYDCWDSSSNSVMTSTFVVNHDMTLAPSVINHDIDGLKPDNFIPTVIFDKQIDPASLVNNVVLKTISTNTGENVNMVVSGIVVYDSTTLTMCFLPTQSLMKGYQYELVITTGVKDSHGNCFNQQSEYTFSTYYDCHTDNVFVVDPARFQVELPGNLIDIDYTVKINSNPIAGDSISVATGKLVRDWGYEYIPGTMYEIKLHDSAGSVINKQFSRPAKLCYKNVDGTFVFRLDTEKSLWVKTPSIKTLDGITAQVAGFSIYCVMNNRVLGITGLGEVYAYPVPWRPNANDVSGYGSLNDGITFTNMVEECVIKIYNIAGEQVKTINCNVPSYKWDGKDDAGTDLASGVYMYIIKSNTSGDKKSGKLMIIR